MKQDGVFESDRAGATLDDEGSVDAGALNRQIAAERVDVVDAVGIRRAPRVVAGAENLLVDRPGVGDNGGQADIRVDHC